MDNSRKLNDDDSHLLVHKKKISFHPAASSHSSADLKAQH